MPHKDSWEKSPGGMWRPCGDLQPITIAQPAAGANFSFRLGGGGVYKFKSLVFTFVTSAVAANRGVNVTFTHGGLLFFQAQSFPVHTASFTTVYCCFPGAPIIASLSATAPIPAPIELYLPGETVIASSISLIDTGDQVSAIGLFVESFPFAGEY